MLAKEIRKDRNINGIVVRNEEIKLSQYADDTTLILDGSRESLKACLRFETKKQKLFGLGQNVGAVNYNFLREISNGQITK